VCEKLLGDYLLYVNLLAGFARHWLDDKISAMHVHKSDEAFRHFDGSKNLPITGRTAKGYDCCALDEQLLAFVS